MQIRFYVLLIIFYVLVASKSNAQDSMEYIFSSDSLTNQLASESKVYHVLKTSSTPKIDGKLNDDCWQSSFWDDSFIQQRPLQAEAPSNRTELSILYDQDNLYVAFKCYDSEPDKIRAILSRRDESIGDLVGIAIDSYNDNQTAFEFDMTAAGQKIDFMVEKDGECDFNWDAVWDGAATVQDSVWYVEMKIPFSQLRFSTEESQSWGMQAYRWTERIQEEDHWKLVPADSPAMVYFWGDMSGIERENSDKNIEFLPYSSIKYSPDSDNNNDTQLGFGLDGKIGLTSDFTLDYTINPDFGQVEADPSVLSLTAYEVFYDEKRPFFLEGNTILDYSMGNDLLFYSRRIGHSPSHTPTIEDEHTLKMPDNTSIISALKLTGKNKKGLSLGIMQSITQKEEATIQTNTGNIKETVEPFTNYMVGRIKQDFNNGNTTLGGMVTSVFRDINDQQLEFLPKSSTVGGIDFNHNWKNRKYYIDIKAFYSDIQGSEEAISELQLASQHYFQREDASHLEYDPTKTSLTGHGGEVSLGKQSGKLKANGKFGWRSPGVDLNDIGYMYQADYLEENIQIKYQQNTPTGIFRNYWTKLSYNQLWSYFGEQNDQEIESHTYLRFRNLWSIHYILKRNFNTYDTRELRGGPSLYMEPFSSVLLNIQSAPSKNLYVSFSSKYGTSDKYNSNLWSSSLYFLLQLSDNFSISSTTGYSKISDYNKYAGTVTLNDGTTGYMVSLLDQNILKTTLRIEYFITPELSLQYYVNPYSSTGKYSDFRRVNNSTSKDPTKRYIQVDGHEENSIYTFNEADQSYNLYNPDFNYQEFNSNLVARWEFRPGSTLYAVWNSSRYKVTRGYEPSISKSFGDIFNLSAKNVFMLKFSYWFSL